MRFLQPLRIALPSFLAGLILGGVSTGIFAAMGGSARFSDIPPGSYYDQAVGELVDVGIIRGNADGTFSPGSYVSRADLAVILKRLLDHVGGVTQVRERRVRVVPPPPLPPPSTSLGMNSAGAKGGPPSTTIPAGSFRFTLGKFSVKEDIGFAGVSVVRTGGKRGKVTVEYALTQGTATSGEDYEVVSGTLTFEDGETSKTFTIKIKDDTQGEGPETFTVLLRNPTGGALLSIPSETQITIADNETSSQAPPPSPASSTPSSTLTLAFSAYAYEMAEDKGSIIVTVLRGGSTAGSVAVSYATSDGTAKKGIDYTEANGTLSFASGETQKTFTVTLANDSDVEGNKALTLKLSSPTGGAALGNPSTATLTSVDTEVLTFGAGAFRFEFPSYQASEADGSALITVRRVNGADGAVSVQYATSDGSAKSGSDYTATSGTLTFAAGEVKKAFSLPLLEDVASDPEEKVNLTLSTPSSGTSLSEPGTAVLTIYE